MHEVSVCEAIARTATEHTGGGAVSRVAVRIGRLRQVVPEALDFAWPLVVEGTPLAAAELDVEYVSAVVACRACGAETTLEVALLLCGACDGTDVRLVRGEEFDLVAVDVREPSDV